MVLDKEIADKFPSLELAMLEFEQAQATVRTRQQKMLIELDSNRKTFRVPEKYLLDYSFLEAAYENLKVEYKAYRDLKELESIII